MSAPRDRRLERGQHERMPHAALTADERSILQASVREVGIAGTARKFGLSRHAVSVLIAPGAKTRPGTVALARERFAYYESATLAKAV